MKYAQEITIDAPLETVVKLFGNPDNEKYWRPQPINVEHLSGTPGQPGAKSRMRFRMGKREFDLVETITARNLPQEFSGTYDADSMVNTMKHSFRAVGANKTVYKTEVDYVFKALMPKLMSLVMPGFFKKQTFKYMKTFKDFAEGKS
jgi:hypothetical protein